MKNNRRARSGGLGLRPGRLVHDHIPFFIAVGANSPNACDEILFSRARKTKPATLELRVLDANLPEFVLAATCMFKAVTLNWLAGRAATNRIRAADYIRARQDAAEKGVRAKLCWNGEWVTVP